MTIEKKLLGTNPVSGEVLPEGVSFDGHLGNSATDYLLRTTPLTGQADSKTFTLSTFIYWPEGTNATLLYLGNNNFNCFLANGGNRVSINAKNASGTTVLRFEAPTTDIVPRNTWVNVQMSFDLSDTSKRHIYVNEIDITAATFAGSYPRYVDDNIDFTPAAGSGNTDTSYRIGAGYSAQGKFGGRLAHLFLDYTYRDLSTTSNRRLFIDADGKPSSTIPSSPILYLPMKDAATAGSNSGTGGDFTVNGVLATAERGPNQDNCSASTFDGSADYLSKTSFTGASNSKTFTVSMLVTSGQTATNRVLDLAGTKLFCHIGSSGTEVTFIGRNTANNEIFNVRFYHNVLYRNALFTFSFDLANSANRHAYIDGVIAGTTAGNPASVQWSSYTNDTIGIAESGNSYVGRRVNFTHFNGSLGEFYLDTAYMDLATDNPFWDSDTNRPNSVRKVIADTGVTPLIALPIIGNDAGNNLGTGGDFTVNSGPFVGARGGSEFWARGAKGNGSTGYLSRAGVGMSNSKTVSGLICFNVPSGQSGTDYLFATRQSSGYLPYFKIMHTASLIYLDGANTDESRIFQMNFGYQPATSYVLIFCIDMSDQNKSYVSLNGTVSANYTTYTDAAFGFSEAAETSIMSLANTVHSAADINSFYLTTDYIDFTQEANRNKFVDQLGYPKNLTQQIEDGDIPNPHIYMKFEDTAALGTNSGTGGNFTVNGTVTAGSDAKT